MSDAVAVALVYSVPIVLGQVGLFAQAARSHRATQRVERSVGAENGETVHELLVEIAKLVEYQHGRNHDILATLGTLSDRVEQLAGRG